MTLKEALCQRVTPLHSYIADRRDLLREVTSMMRRLPHDQQVVFTLLLDRLFCRASCYYFLMHTKTWDPQNLDNPVDAPMPDLRYLWIYTVIREMFNRTIMVKSRQQLLSWFASGCELWSGWRMPGGTYFFHSTSEAKAGYGGGGQFYNGEHIMGRAWILNKSLPAHLRVPAHRQNKPIVAMSYLHREGASTFYAVPDNPNIMAGYVPRGVMDDEVSLQRNAREFFGTVGPALAESTTYNAIYTPRGKTGRGKWAYEMHSGKKDDDPHRGRYVHQPPMEELMPLDGDGTPEARLPALFSGQVLKDIFAGNSDILPGKRFLGRINADGMVALELYWRSNPRKGRHYKATRIDNYPPVLQLRDFECSHEAQEGEFLLWRIDDDNEIYADTEPVPGIPVIRCWDFGRHAAVVCAQIVPTGPTERSTQLRILGEVDSIGRKTIEFAHAVRHYCAVRFGAGWEYTDIADVAGRQVDRQTLESDLQVIQRAIGVRPMNRKIDRPVGVEVIGAKILERLETDADGNPCTPGLVISPIHCPVLTRALRGEVMMKSDGGIDDGPRFDDIAHVSVALRYIAAWFLHLEDVVGDFAVKVPPKPHEILTPDRIVERLADIAFRTRLDEVVREKCLVDEGFPGFGGGESASEDGF